MAGTVCRTQFSLDCRGGEDSPEPTLSMFSIRGRIAITEILQLRRDGLPGTDVASGECRLSHGFLRSRGEAGNLSLTSVS